MKNRRRMTFLAAVTLLTPFQVSALSVRQFDSEPREEQTEYVFKAVDKIVADVAKVDPALSKAIHDYFEVTPSGKDEPPGLLAFAGDLGAVEDLADQGKADLDKVQIEGLLLGIIKRDVMPKQASKNGAPTVPAHK